MALSYSIFKRNCPHKKEVKETILEAFPSNERLPFFIIKHIAKRKGIEFRVYEDETGFVSIAYLLKNELCTYLLYFAVAKDKRNKQYGSKILDLLIEENKDKEFYLCIEIPDEKNEMTIKRLNFYRRHGLIDLDALLIENIEYLLMANKEIKDYKSINELLKISYFFKYRPYVKALKRR